MKNVDVPCDENDDLPCDDNVTVQECRPHISLQRSHEENLVPQAQDDNQRPQRNRKAPAYLTDYETEFDD